ncbi:MAG: two-component system sensor histidine kinase NtrB [Xanthobacteraceae bacterium]
MAITVPSVSEARLSSLLDSAAVGIVVVNEQGCILTFNKACERLFGYGAAEILGENVRTIIPAEYTAEHDASFTEFVRGGVSTSVGMARELRGLHRDGSAFPLELSISEAMTPDGRQFVGILRDLRPRRATEQRLGELQADLVHVARISAMDEMGAALAHELNQPLTALMLYLQALERTNAKQAAGDVVPASVAGILDKAMREAERAANIIQRMRHFIEKREPLRRLVDLSRLVDEVVELNLPASRPGVRLARALAPDLPQVLVDPIQIQQIIVNLVRNAMEAVGGISRAEIRVTTRLGNDVVVLTVEDNGPGIPADALSHLFKAFATEQGSDMGLGLTISKTIAQTHGGDLTVDPGGNGRGARFTLTLPLPAAAGI